MFKEVSEILDLPKELGACSCRFYKEEVLPLNSYRASSTSLVTPETIIHLWIQAPTWLEANLVKEYSYQKFHSPAAPRIKFEYDMKKSVEESPELVTVMHKPIDISEMMRFVRSGDRELAFSLQRKYCEETAIDDYLSWCKENNVSVRAHFICLSPPFVELEFKFELPEDKVLFDLRWRNN